MRTKKRFGQHFLTDQYVIDRIISCMDITANDHVIEIGPGSGILTKPLSEMAKKLEVIELDRDLIPHLEAMSKEGGHFIIHNQDVLTVDFKLLADASHKIRLVGNLPYNISTPLLFHLFEQLEVIQDMVFMFQKEVADRLSAKPGNKNYGRLSVMAQYFCEVESLFDIQPQAFNPPPKVMSSIVRLKPLQPLPYPAKDENQLSILVRTAFSMRRKTISNALKGFISSPQLLELGINPGLRPEELSVEQFVLIANKAHI